MARNRATGVPEAHAYHHRFHQRIGGTAASRGNRTLYESSEIRVRSLGRCGLRYICIMLITSTQNEVYQLAGHPRFSGD